MTDGPLNWRRRRLNGRRKKASVARERHLFSLRVEKREGRGGFVEPNPLLLFGLGRKKRICRLCDVVREHIFSRRGSWFGSVALFVVVDPIWRFLRFPSETVIMASGWIVGQMSGTAFPSSSLLARWLRVLFNAATFFSFLRRLAFNHFRDTT